MGGLIGINDTWLRSRGPVKYNKLDEANTNGYYWVDGTSDDPSISEPALKDWGTLIVVKGSVITQILIPANVRSVFLIRTKLSAGFTKWSKFEGILLTI